MLTKEQKKVIVAEVAEVARDAQAAIAAEYRGITVAQMTKLRSDARNAGVYLRVVKNTLARRALAGTDFACMEDAIKGPLVLAFSRQEPAAAARIIRDFAKSNEKLIVKAIALGGRLLSPSDLGAVATMPTRDEALSRLMALIKAPIEKFVRTAKAPIDKFVRTVAAVRDQRQMV